MNKKGLLSFIRHTLTFIGGLAVAKGWISSELSFEIVGALVSVLGVVWGIQDKIENK